MAKKSEICFEKAMAELETIVESLEGGELTLDKSLEEFERAISLVRICEAKLSEAKQRVKILIEAQDGSVTDKDFDGAVSDET